MSEYLYVCHFSNGHIKVGHSIDPVSRIAQHADRVACLGVELIDHHVVLCVGDVMQAESSLINSCAELATCRNKNEWFSGIDYPTVCEFADVYAKKVADDCVHVGWSGYVKQILKTGLTQCQLAEAVGVSQPAIAKICTGKTADLSFNLGYALLLIGRRIGLCDPSIIPVIKESARV